jgi:sugar lactone lactonase YvrE
MIVFNPEGDILDTWGHGEFGNPHGVTIGPDGSVYTVDNGDHTVKKFTPKGEKVFEIQAQHPAKEMSGDPFCRPAHLALDKHGNMLVADGYSNARVHKYDPDGGLITSWGESGTGPGQFNIVHNLVVDEDGLVYVADRENQRVQVFDGDGAYITQWNDMSRVAAICIDAAGEDPLIYLGEYFCGIGSNTMGTNLGPRVSVMDRRGNVLARVGTESFGDEPGRFYSPHGIAVDSKGDIYVAEVAWSDYGSQMDPPRELRSMQKLVRKRS